MRFELEARKVLDWKGFIMRLLISVAALLLSSPALAETDESHGKKDTFDLIVEVCREASRMEPTKENVERLNGSEEVTEEYRQLDAEAYVGRLEMAFDRIKLTPEAREAGHMICRVYNHGVVDATRMAIQLIDARKD